MTGLDFSRLVGVETADRHETAPTPNTLPSTPPRVFAPTQQQQAFIDALISTDRNITLEALAGTGKSSSILMGVDAYLTVFPSHEIIVCAYNKSIQLEMDGKLKAKGYDWRQVGCQTVHSMGMSLLRYVYRPEIDEHKVRKLIDARRDTQPRTSPYWAYPQQIRSLVSFAKQAAVGFFPELPIGDRSVWYELADHFDVDFDGSCDIDAVVTCAQAIYGQSLSITDLIDFDDMVLLPLVKGIRVKYAKDLILGDESQDWSRARQALVRMFMKPKTGRLVVVGDRHQCHPPGTRIEVFAGIDSFIEDLTTGETVRGWNRNAQKMVAGRKVTVASRPYAGDLLTIRVGDRSTRVTPNHRLLCRWADRETPTCVTYLMWREGFGFRVGWCKLFANSKGAINFHLAHRTGIEKADRVWILDATASRTQASAYESIIAANWGLPTATFEPCFGATHLVPETIRHIFDNLTDNDERGRSCLIRHGLDFDLPLYPWPGMTTKTQGRRTYFEVFAANLLPELMAVPLPDGQNRWATIDEVTREGYQGPVYSLDVEEDHSYNADGIVVLNSIYAFSGADSAAMDRLTQELDAVVLPLSVTWRCPKAVVRLAQTIVPDIQAAPDAPEGEVLRQPGLTTKAEWEAGRSTRDLCETQLTWVFLDDLDPAPGRDAILCRNNAPLVPLAYALIRLGIPAKVEGRKIGEGLQSLVNRWQVRSTADLLRRLDDYRAREVQKSLAKGDEAKAQEVEDRVDTLREIIREVNRRGRHDIESVLDFIDRLFADGTGESRPCVTLASYHKSKGGEWERVILIEHHSRCPSRAARQEWQKRSEENLAYVAYTRAKDTLVFAG